MKTGMRVLLFFVLVCGCGAMETSGPGYRLKIEGEKSFHFENRLSNAPAQGFYRARITGGVEACDKRRTV